MTPQGLQHSQIFNVGPYRSDACITLVNDRFHMMACSVSSEKRWKSGQRRSVKMCTSEDPESWLIIQLGFKQNSVKFLWPSFKLHMEQVCSTGVWQSSTPTGSNEVDKNVKHNSTLNLRMFSWDRTPIDEPVCQLVKDLKTTRIQHLGFQAFWDPYILRHTRTHNISVNVI